MDTKTTKSFSWSSVIEAKLEYDEWHATLAEVLDKEKVGFCLDTNFAEFFRPIPPEPQLGNTQPAVLAYRKEMIDYQTKITEYRNKFMIAIGYLKSSLTYGTKVCTEVDTLSWLQGLLIQLEKMISLLKDGYGLLWMSRWNRN